MRIAVLGWGSLLWEPKDLQLATGFELIGPPLPVEFCRVSKNRRLTLVIDESLGTLCRSYAGVSAFTSLDEAIDNLRVREGMSGAGDVGYVDLATQARGRVAAERHPHAVETIAAWALDAGYDAAVWTALGSRFEGVSGEPFSVTAAVRFLEHLEENDAEAFARALEYIRRAPAATQTPVREAASARWPEDGPEDGAALD